jgi:hypothetical protein
LQACFKVQIRPATHAQKKPQPEAGLFSLFSAAALLAGPSLDRCGTPFRAHRSALSFQASCQPGKVTGTRGKSAIKGALMLAAEQRVPNKSPQHSRECKPIGQHACNQRP